MLKRFLSSAGLIISTIVVILFKPLSLISAIAITLVALWEFFLMIEKKQVRLFKIFGLILGGLIPVSIFFRFSVTREMQFLFILAALFMLFLLELTRQDTHEVILSISATVFGVLYISWCFSFVIRVRLLDNGMALVGFLFLVTKAQDMGAYIIGTYFGKRSFLRRVSPNKSREGALGGILSSVAVAVCTGGLLTGFALYHVLFLGLLLGVVSQLGDLFESLIKRDCGIKDSGNVIPGLGGILDIIDSIIFTAPVFYLYITMINI